MVGSVNTLKTRVLPILGVQLADVHPDSSFILGSAAAWMALLTSSASGSPALPRANPWLKLSSTKGGLQGRWFKEFR